MPEKVKGVKISSGFTNLIHVGTMYRMPLPLWPAVSAFLAAMLLIGGTFGYLKYSELDSHLSHTSEELASSTEKVNTLSSFLSDKTEENVALSEALENEKNKNEVFERQIKDISGTVGYLAKLQATDPELLKKYSRVYFLNENYAPKKLALIPKTWLYNGESTLEIHADVALHLTDLLEEADEDGLSLRIISAFRSFDTQAALKTNYRVTYGSGSNQFSADQGYSEHQLGTTLDFTTPTVGSSFTGFEKTPEYAWLLEHAHKYGFILSYPKNNKFYQYEPWHWRFVGVELATKLHREEKYFYDMDQRDIDQYLGDIFE